MNATTLKLPCPECEDGQLVSLIGDFETATDGQSITVPNVSMERCSSCNESFLTPEGSQQVSKHLAKVSGSLEPGELETFLEKYQLTHREAASILGIGEKNFSRWLSGKQRISTSMSRYIRTLLAHPDAFETLRTRNWALPKEAVL